ncbi:PREDICTED: ribonuclease 3 isoform X1 [Rhagoletis zephyria]|uniref:ribonuclease 3 isoform X1 n=1 Tax=Rhagoletis zephyria TaxID=28612 RepID=UPI0008115366|nr:PREDICTED: ribonuclease 3 isoform X1 [Rhagoletis zephyria]
MQMHISNRKAYDEMNYLHLSVAPPLPMESVATEPQPPLPPGLPPLPPPPPPPAPSSEPLHLYNTSAGDTTNQSFTSIPQVPGASNLHPFPSAYYQTPLLDGVTPLYPHYRESSTYVEGYYNEHGYRISSSTQRRTEYIPYEPTYNEYNYHKSKYDDNFHNKYRSGRGLYKCAEGVRSFPYEHGKTNINHVHSATRSSFRNTSSSTYIHRPHILPISSPRSYGYAKHPDYIGSYNPREKHYDSRNDSKGKRLETERDRLLKNWRSNYCETSEDIAEKLAELGEQDEDTRNVWVRSSPADPFYRRTNASNEVVSTSRLEALCKLFEEKLIQRAERVRKTLPPYEPPTRKSRRRLCKHKSEACSSSSEDSSDDELKIEQDCCMEELSRKIQHPYRVHADLWHNDSGEMNDGPLCRCSAKSRRIGIRHGIYPGETGYPKCVMNSNNAPRLHHYRITISPPTNFLTKTPTIIKHDEHEFLFEGFSMLTHSPLADLPTCKVIRFNIEYTILYVAEKMPENFTIRELELFDKFLFDELLELVDFSMYPNGMTGAETCPAFHFLPRFVRDLPDNGKEVLAMSEVLRYLLDSAAPLVDREQLHCINDINQHDWQDYVDFIKGMLVTKPGYKPCSVRVDQLDRNVSDLPECIDAEENVSHPAIVHFGIRPPQLSYAGNPEYQKAWREYVKYRHLMANMSKPSFIDKRKLEEKEARLQEMRTQGRMKRNITVAVSSKGYYRTGIMCDIVQHAMLIPVLTGHLRFHRSLDLLEQNIGYNFKNRYLLQLALTHPSYKENYGTNPDHARNSLTNCGIRQPEYGDRKIHYLNTRKRGINTLINIMSRFGKEYETMSNITHNERLEFLGDAVVEFLSSIHLFFMFPDLEEGGLATYRAAIVQNQHLALLAKKLHLEEYMLYAHGSDLCHELELRHAMANCFEALMGALLLDGGISVADEVFMNALYMEDEQLREIWKNYPEHPLQEQEPLGDRGCIASYPVLQELTKFEESIGIQFKHIRLLARAFTDRSIGFTHLTLGSNQRLEFLGDTVLQLICSEYLYRHFPEHHEGHLSLLRSSLVNNRTQAVVCDDLGMTKYAVYSNPKVELKTKDRADLLEAFLGALYVDKGLLYCEQFCHVCLFPRLQIFIMNQDWNDPKSKLQQCCLTLRTMEGGEPDIPIYKVIESIGPTNTRVYTVAVYFRSKRLATATGSSIQQAEMNAAKQALDNSRDLFPQLDHQKRVIAKSIKKQKGAELKTEFEEIMPEQTKPKTTNSMEDESHLPKQYRIREDISSDELPEDDINDGGIVTIAGHLRHSSSSHSSSEEEVSEKHFTSKRKKKKRTKKTNSIEMSSNSCSSKVMCHEMEDNQNANRRNCEDVSSDDCFEENSISNLENHELPSIKPASSKEDPRVVKNTMLHDLKDLVEDVSSNSDIESGEISS